MILINCFGTKISNFNIPPFKLMKGDYLTLSVPYLLNSNSDEEILNVMTSSLNKGESNLMINDKINVVEDCIGIVSLWRKIFYNYTLKMYLQKKYNLSVTQIEELLSKNHVDSDEKIFSIGTNGKKIISIQIALLKNDQIIIDTAGMDYNGIEKLYEILQNREEGKTIIEIRYPNTNNYSTFPNSNYIELKALEGR